ncbi:hypothetical protein QBC43DRAFT_356552 [Cladorrhinum sp. PSN259]|nr:hypothetical protein QBC43DRAFT_356552 [Cladorrhinum sp. PSN259]
MGNWEGVEYPIGGAIRYLTVTSEITTTRYITTFIPASTVCLTRTMTSTVTSTHVALSVKNVTVTATSTFTPQFTTLTVTKSFPVSVSNTAASSFVSTPTIPAWSFDFSEPESPYLHWHGPFPKAKSDVQKAFQPMGIDDLYYSLIKEERYRGRAKNNVTEMGTSPEDPVDPHDFPEGLSGCLRNLKMPFDTNVLRVYLERLVEIGGKWTIDGTGCHRLGCLNNSAIWWCSMTERPPSVSPPGPTNATSLYKKGMRIIDTCWDDTKKTIDYPMGIEQVYYALWQENPQRLAHFYSPQSDWSKGGKDEDAGPVDCRNSTDTPAFNPAVIRRYLETLLGIGGWWTIDSLGCHRLGCQDHSAIWWCSYIYDEDRPAENRPVSTSADDIYDMAQRVINHCWDDNAKVYKNGYQWFNDGHPRAAFTRVFLGYADCTDSITKHPHDYYANFQNFDHPQGKSGLFF